MPRGPKGQKRPADVISNAVHVMRIATGEVEESPVSARRAGGLKGGPARSKKLTPEERSAIARKGSHSRWKKQPASS